MVKAIEITAQGGPEVMSYVDIDVGSPNGNEVRLKQTAIGLNFIDVYHRDGTYKVPSPSGLGLEAAGVITEIGPDVRDFKVGERVAYGVGPIGAYAQERLIAADRIVKIPDGIDDQTAAALMLKGLTAQYLLRRTYRVKAGETILWHAAAGGVGLIACQWAKALGATVIGTVGSDAKMKLAKEAGCDHVINYSRENFKDRVLEITGGKGVPVVYDGLGKDSFDDSIDCLSPLGYMVSFGNATGVVPPVDPGLLSAKGSLFLTRPSLMAYMSTPEHIRSGAEELFELVQSGKIKISINQTWPLSEAADAHRALEGRQTTGSTILIP